MTYHETIAAARNLHPHEVEIWLGIVGQQMRAQPLDAALRQADRVIDEMRARQTDPALRVPPPLDGAEVRTATLEDAEKAARRVEPAKGELTEEAVAAWSAEAFRVRHGEHTSGVFRVGSDEIRRAVALMREGLAAKTALERYKRAGNSASPPEASQQLARDLDLAERLVTAERERDTYKRLLDEGAKAVGHDAENERDEARADLDITLNRAIRAERALFNAGWTVGSQEWKPPLGPKPDFAGADFWRARAEKAEARLRPAQTCGGCPGCGSNDCPDALDIAIHRAEKAEAALAEVQPVLDVVVRTYCIPKAQWVSDFSKTLQSYADRRREQAKGAS